MIKPRKIGDKHVIDVANILKQIVNCSVSGPAKETTKQTVEYILSLFPDIIGVESKFDQPNPDQQPDLTVFLTENRKEYINLFYIKGKGRIQPKNLGALSFLEKYFLSEDLQQNFNSFFEEQHVNYLKKLLSYKEDISLYSKKSELNQKVKQYYQKFDENINPVRQSFLFNLREYTYELLREQYNGSVDSINHAFEKLLLLDSVNIITRHSKENKCLLVEELKLPIDPSAKIRIYKKGKNSVGINAGKHALLLRFKFESGPSSSIKLATSYEEVPSDYTVINEYNRNNLFEFEQLIADHRQTEYGNKSNAIGKCNEAIVYYSILKNNLGVNQVDSNEYKDMFSRYSPLVPKNSIKDIKKTADMATEKLHDYFQKKYDKYLLDSIQLVPDSYLENRLDSSDLKIILVVNSKIIEEKFSLKAIANKTKKLTSKNPGVGTILGDQYFGIGTMEERVNQVKEEFHSYVSDHQQCLVKISNEIGSRLSKAQQSELKKGIQALLGDSALIVSFYTQYESVVLEHGNITSEITVSEKHPTPIQTTLLWNDNEEELSLRVKFSSGQEKGWSSLKLACEVKINTD
jgi:hypothetical protein